MPFMIQCDNKGCFKQSEALLSVDDNNVICGECGKSIKNVTHFAKVQLKTIGQTTKANKPSKAFSVLCKICNKNDQPKIMNGKVICAHCNGEIVYLSQAFVQALKANIKS